MGLLVHGVCVAPSNARPNGVGSLGRGEAGAAASSVCVRAGHKMFPNRGTIATPLYPVGKDGLGEPCCTLHRVRERAGGACTSMSDSFLGAARARSVDAQRGWADAADAAGAAADAVLRELAPEVLSHLEAASLGCAR